MVIRTMPNGTARAYVKGQELQYDTLESTSVELLIDKGYTYCFALDRVDEKQMDIRWQDKWSDDGSQTVKAAVDYDVLNGVYPFASSTNKGATAGAKSAGYNLGVVGTPVTITKANILDYIVDAGAVLSENNRPETGRWMVLPVWAAALLKKSDLKDASMTGDAVSPLRNGRIGVIDGFTIYISNNYAAGSDSGSVNILFGDMNAITFATQITENEALTNPKTFGKLVRMLFVYGYEVVDPLGLGVLYGVKG